MKKDKEWLIKRVENYIPLNDKMAGHVVDNIHQPDEPEVLPQDLPVIPVIPKHVADWLDDNIEKHRTIYSFIISLVEVVDVFADPVPEKVWTYASENLDTMARAYLDGYTVAEEQKYLVSSRESIGFWFLAKNSLNEVSIGTNKDYYDTEWESLKLTEEEIKDYDPRYWAFAVKVEEVQE